MGSLVLSTLSKDERLQEGEIIIRDDKDLTRRLWYQFSAFKEEGIILLAAFSVAQGVNLKEERRGASYDTRDLEIDDTWYWRRWSRGGVNGGKFVVTSWLSDLSRSRGLSINRPRRKIVVNASWGPISRTFPIDSPRDPFR